MSTPKEMFANIAKNIGLNPEKATSLNAVFKFDLAGDDGGTWTIDLRNGTTENFVTVGEGGPDPSVAISMTSDDFAGIVSGKVNPMQAFMMGKIKVKGDMGLATKLQSIVAMAKD
jgi:putative sterol carrier protein